MATTPHGYITVVGIEARGTEEQLAGTSELTPIQSGQIERSWRRWREHELIAPTTHSRGRH